MKTFAIHLNEEQAAEINKQWNEHGGLGKAMLAQPRIFSESDEGSYRNIKFAILDAIMAEEVARLLDT